VSTRARSRGLGLPIALSAVLHVVAAVLLFALARPTPEPARPPIYKVNIIAAPAGPRAVGVVTPTPATAPPPDAKVPPRAEVTPAAPVLPPKATQRTNTRTPPPPATPLPSTAKTNTPVTKAPIAGGGPTGGRGTDVATVRTEGIEFPYPGYLNNIVRQIAKNFNPDDRGPSLRAEVMFLLHRDGTITNLRFLKRSGVYAFDLEAQGAIEAAASSHGFGPLPAGFTDDVLPVIFSFDPALVH
jgi:periplasmic protein TonB